MEQSVTEADSTAKVDKVHRVVMTQIKSEWRMVDSLRNARAKAGRAMTQAIGHLPMKAFGNKRLISAVCSGEKVPDYLARIVADRLVNRRFALALLEDDSGVVVKTEVRIRRRG